jgi:hypothetical protein
MLTCCLGLVELWFAAADFSKLAVGANVVTEPAFLALLFDLQFAVSQKSHRDFAVARSFVHKHRDVVLDRRPLTPRRHWPSGSRAGHKQDDRLD